MEIDHHNSFLANHTIGDIARREIFNILRKPVKEMGGYIEISDISVRIYKENKLVGRVMVYPNSAEAIIMTGKGSDRISFAQPDFFDLIRAQLLIVL